MSSFGEGCEVWDTHMENLQGIFSQVSSQFCLAAKPFNVFLTLWYCHIHNSHRKEEVTRVSLKEAGL